MYKKGAIVHVDMDAFFAAIEQRDNPELKDKPVIIGADPKIGRGVVSTASYEARRYGVRSAMPITQAYRLCPHGVFLPVRKEKYHQVSKQILEILRQYTPLVEPLSLDEAFLDLTSNESWEETIKVAKEIQNRIYNETKLNASVGVSYNKFLAKLASDWKKPRGFMVIKKSDLERLVWPLPVNKLWGVGPKTKKVLVDLGFTTIGSLARCPENFLNTKLGKHGEELRLLALGIDNRPVKPDDVIKSIGKETTFKYDVTDSEYLKTTILTLCENVGFRLRENGFVCKTVTLKLRYSDFETHTRNYSLNEPTNLDRVLYETAVKLLIKNWNYQPLRLVGVTAASLRPANLKQLSIFSNDTHNETNLIKIIDNIREKYGFESLKRARTITREPQKRRGQ